MKWLLIADVHLDNNPDHAYRWDVLDTIDARLEDGRAEGVIVLGDWSDAKDRHPAAFVNRVADRVRHWASIGRVVFLRGNHDYVDHACPFFGWLDAIPNVVFVREPAVIDGALFVPNGASWASGAAWRSTLGLTGHKAIFAHESFNGCVSSNGTKLDGIPLATVSKKRTGGSPVISGDIHVPQQLGNVTYVGAPHSVRFGDTYDPRLLLWDSEANTFKNLPNPGIRRLVVEFVENDENEWTTSCEIREGDHVKARYIGSQADLPQWPEIRERVRDYIERKRARSFGEEYRVDAPVIAEPLAPEEKAVDDSVLFARVCEQQGVDAKLAELALEWIDSTTERVEAPRRAQIEFQAIALRGFRSYVDDFVFTFPTTPGVYMITGPNGSGKSTLFQGIYWALYNRLSTGLIASQVGSWEGASKTSVVNEILLDGRLVTVTRDWNPNTLLLQQGLDEPRKVETAEVVRMLGIDRDQFLGVVYHAQDGDRFMRLRPGPQLQAVSNMLGLERWSERVAAARKSAKLATAEAQQYRIDHARADALVTNLEERLAHLEETSAQWEAGELQARILEYRRNAWVNARRSEVDKLRQEDERERSRLRKAQKNAKDWAARAQRIADSIVDVCGECGTPLEPLEPEDLEAAQARLAEAQTRYKTAKRLADTSAAHIAQASAKLTAAISEVKRVRECFLKKQSPGPEVEAELQAIEPPHEFPNPHAPEIARTREQLASATQRRTSAEKSRDEALGRVSVANHAAELYASARLAILEGAALEFETYVNANLPQLGLAQWSIRCRTTNDAGESAWSIQVKAPGAPDNVDFRAWSGGERTRLVVAGEAAYADLAASRRGFRIPFEMWDEPTEYLEGEGLHDIMSFFRWRSSSLDKQVWVIDHRTQHAGEVDRCWIAEKTDTGTRLREA